MIDIDIKKYCNWKTLGLILIIIYVLSLVLRDSGIEPLREGLSEEDEQTITDKIDNKLDYYDKNIESIKKNIDIDNFEEDIDTLLNKVKSYLVLEGFKNISNSGEWSEINKIGEYLRNIDRYQEGLKSIA